MKWPGRQPSARERAGAARNDPYWEFFIQQQPADARNLLPAALRGAKGGGVYSTKAEVHSPDVLAGHVKELASFLGAEATIVVRLPPDSGYPLGIVCAQSAEHDLNTAKGIGGQAPALDSVFVTFNLSAWIRELGYQSTILDLDGAALWAQAGRGRLDADGLLSVPGLGPYVFVGSVVGTDLPLQPD